MKIIENATFSDNSLVLQLAKHIHRSLITTASARTPAAAKLNALSPKGAGPVSRFQGVFTSDRAENLKKNRPYRPFELNC